MTLQLDISYKELITFLKGLPKEQWQEVKKLVEGQSATEFEAFLLAAPTFDDSQLSNIEDARDKLNKWRVS